MLSTQKGSELHSRAMAGVNKPSRAEEHTDPALHVLRVETCSRSRHLLKTWYVCQVLLQELGIRQ